MVTTQPKAPAVPAFPGNVTFYGGLAKRKDVPSSAAHFRGLFCDWVIVRFGAERREGADLFPVPGSPAAQLQDLADCAALGLPFDLSDAVVSSHFIEWLSEAPARADWWRRFLKLNGPCETL